MATLEVKQKLQLVTAVVLNRMLLHKHLRNSAQKCIQKRRTPRKIVFHFLQITVVGISDKRCIYKIGSRERHRCDIHSTDRLRSGSDGIEYDIHLKWNYMEENEDVQFDSQNTPKFVFASISISSQITIKGYFWCVPLLFVVLSRLILDFF